MDEGTVLPFPGLPLADATGTVSRRRPGRPRKIEKRPTVDDLLHHAEVSEQRLRHLEADDVLRAIRGRADANEVLRRVREQIASEAAVLEFDRIEQQKRGRESGMLSSRRIDALARVAQLELEALRLSATVVDPHAEGVQRMFELWVRDVVAVARQCMPESTFDAFTNTLAARLEGWEERAAAVAR